MKRKQSLSYITNLFVFVHGLKGSEWDLRLFKNHLSVMYPDIFVFCSSINDNTILDNIE